MSPEVPRRQVLQSLAALAAGLFADGDSERRLMDAVRRANNEGTSATPLRSICAARQWVNTKGLAARDLQRKVVLANVWTYTCINSLRPLPYLKAWAEKYEGRGLAVIGVHTPEFGIEKDIANVQKAVAALGIRYPVALDSDRRIWDALDNSAWPAFYFIGTNGRLRHKAVGEGAYGRAEQWIQQLLSEGSGAQVDDRIEAVQGEGVLAAPDLRNLASPETYVGYQHASGFVSAGGFRSNAPHRYSPVPDLKLNQWTLEGVWVRGAEFAKVTESGGSIVYRFHARDLHLVLAPAAKGSSIRFRVTLDGKAPGEDRGTDVNADGSGDLADARLYHMVRQKSAVADRTFAIEFHDPGACAYCFTFG
jgi:thiol-disulfide isomerase/thioredoxin